MSALPVDQAVAQEALITLKNGQAGTVADLKKLSKGTVLMLILKFNPKDLRDTKILGIFHAVYTCENHDPGSDCCLLFTIWDADGPETQYRWLEYGHDGFRHLSDFVRIEVLTMDEVAAGIIKNVCYRKQKLELEKRELESRLARVEARVSEFVAGLLA